MHTSWIFIKLGFGELWGCMNCSYVKYVFFVYRVIERIVDHVPTLAVKQEWNNVIVSSIHLSVRFDWRNFALTLAVRISTEEFLYNLRLDYVGSGTLSDVHQSSMILVINMDAAGEHRYRLTPIICHLFIFIYLFCKNITIKKVMTWVTEHMMS